MSFASPWMLLGLAAIAIPIWLHIRRRHQGVIPFPAISVLARVARRRKQRLKMRKIFLLIARIVAVAAVVMAVSRPGVAVRRPGGIRSGSALALVIVLDDSLSMRLSGQDGETIFKRAVKLTLAELDRLRPGDGAALILSGYPNRSPIPKVEFDLARVRRAVETAESTYLGGDIDRALRAASRILEKSLLAQREVVVITDLSEGPKIERGEHWPPWSSETGIGFRVLDAGATMPRSNVTVDQVRVSPSPEGVAREAVIEARITNHSADSLKGFEVVLEVEGDEVARGNLDVPPHGATVKKFYHRFGDDGLHRGVVRIREDSLKEDDTHYFSAFVRQSIITLVIDGDYRPGSYRDEAFYLHRAIETPLPGEVPIRSVVVDVDAAQAGPLAGNEVVFLAGVPEVPPALANRLGEFVHQGGGLFVSPSSAGFKSESLESILPAKMRSVRRVTRQRQFFRIAAVNRSHPVFQPFGESPTGLEKTEVRAHLLVEPEPGADRSTLMELVDGPPLLLERRVGRGRVMFLTTTVDRDWTDLPIRPGYLPLVQRAARYLAGRLDDRAPRRIPAGRQVRIEVSQGMQRLLVRGPRSLDTTYPAGELADKSAIDFKDTFVPGHYRVWAEIPGFGGLRELDALGFVVETDPAESNPTRVMSAMDADNLASLTPVEGNLPIWPYLLMAAVLFLLLETWLSGHGLRRSHVARRG
ncbi:MAG: VWA domain-containing protein [Deltaproteobacteria bacterium]|nr:VWA domain-containing protein [Deltaproteobacteria bacterium]